MKSCVFFHFKDKAWLLVWFLACFLAGCWQMFIDMWEQLTETRSEKQNFFLVAVVPLFVFVEVGGTG